MFFTCFRQGFGFKARRKVVGRFYGSASLVLLLSFVMVPCVDGK
jgi:hypothetical protein